MDRFKLRCEYVHCCGRKILELGQADTEELARRWVNTQTRGKKRPVLPQNDLIRTCPVSHCPAKLQIPRYSYFKAGK